MDLEIGQAVISLSGRDKGRYLVVTEVGTDFIFVADGKLRTLDRPKRKNPKHLSATKRVFDKKILMSDRLLREAISDAFGADHR